MSDKGSGGGSFMGVLAGALLVTLLAVGFFAWQGGFGQQQADISIDLPDEVPTPGS